MTSLVEHSKVERREVVHGDSTLWDAVIHAAARSDSFLVGLLIGCMKILRFWLKGLLH